MITVTLDLPEDVAPQIEAAGDDLAHVVAEKLRHPVFSTQVFEQIVDFLAGNPTPEQIQAFKASTEIQKRASELAMKERAGVISPEEITELEGFLKAERFVRQMKSKNYLFLKALQMQSTRV